MQGDAIDFIITWVDGSDNAWLEQRRQYDDYAEARDNREERYRDLGLLKYWFRGVESFAPWVNKIHFVTWGHIPEWLDTNHPRINIVNHKDYIPERFLPTFNSNVLDLNCHRIEGLSEQFVLFNDDTLILNTLNPSSFFIDGLPRASAVLTPMRVVKGTNFFTPFANIAILNEHFDLWESFRKNPRKWINSKYGKEVFRTLLMLPFSSFYGFKENHLPNAFLKKTFEQIWDLEGDALESTCSNRFRGATDISQWLMRQWQVASGSFIPQELDVGHNYELMNGFDDKLFEACLDIKMQKYPMICISDGGLCEEEFLLAKAVLNDLFEVVLPQKSSFER